MIMKKDDVKGRENAAKGAVSGMNGEKPGSVKFPAPASDTTSETIIKTPPSRPAGFGQELRGPSRDYTPIGFGVDDKRRPPGAY